ncbi:VanZ family protein [Opitutaceae bacterium EW11]|nr:VanZ family protein [Opitutaceae bacterium EW11]
MKRSQAQTTPRDWCWPAFVMLVIFVASSQSQVAGPSIPNFDKVAHFFAYGLLGTLWARVPSVQRSKPLGIWLAVLLASAYGVSDEFHQSFTPGRSVDFFDWLSDTCGAALAVWVYRFWSGYRRFLEAPLRGNVRIDLPADGTPD